MKRMKRATWLTIVIAALVASALTATQSLAFRMIQNTGVGRFSSGFLVDCNDAGGFTHWGNGNISWRHNTANQGGEAGVSAALQAAMASWTNVSGAPHSLNYAGTSSAGFVTDGVNVLRWATGEGCSGSCLALTALVLASGQVITETDVTFNNGFNWNTNGSDYDVQAVAAHELGHTLGIHHTNVKKPNGRPTMYATYFGTAGRTLESDDQQALQCAANRYPPSGQQAEPAASRLPSSQHSLAATSPVQLAARPREGGALVRFALATDANVKLRIYDVAGRLVTTLVDGPRGAGEHELAWDGRSDFGKASSGIYFARLVTRESTARATVILAE